MKTLVEISADPQGDVYHSLLMFIRSQCDTFSLVWRHQFRFLASAEQVALALRPYLVREEQTSEWPGTRLLGHEAIVRHYETHHDAIKVLLQPNSLYSWSAPKLPEDLTFYNHTQCWFASIGHEHMAWFEDEHVTMKQVLDAVPGLHMKTFSRT